MNETQLSSFNYQFDTNTGKCLYAQVGLHNESTDSTEFVNASIRVKPDDLPEGKDFMQLSMNDLITIAKKKLAADTAVQEEAKVTEPNNQ
ncbi:hypothetical protein [Limosilactobacillus reuteri]|uniref:hypothetical protein n=1 Tax=Limosilactobacillus reuteri TaxID=1598 RepID=UPI002B05D9CF|nr:hypothetical protein [Limosilactobacillus reuteri]